MKKKCRELKRKINEKLLTHYRHPHHEGEDDEDHYYYYSTTTADRFIHPIVPSFLGELL